jgi:Flp pilus assembly protein TadG
MQHTQIARNRAASAPAGEGGIALFFVAVVMLLLMLAAGLAVDAGRAYLVKAQLSKAVDAAALGAARVLNSGDPQAEAVAIFNANFAAGYMGTTTPDPHAPLSYSLTTDTGSGVSTVRISASSQMPTTLMRLGNIPSVTVNSAGEATRRMVDLSLVVDVSSSIGSQWGAVHDAAQSFIDSFDESHDRLALVTFSDGANVIDQMPSSRGFNKSKVMGDVPGNLPGGSTAMAEGFYRGWDELRTVPGGQQSSLRIIVLFTDGASNSVPGNYPAAAGRSTGLRTYDFPFVSQDTQGQTHNNPTIAGLYDAQTGAQSGPYTDGDPSPYLWNDTYTLPGVPVLPATSYHSHNRNSGTPTAFPLQSGTLTVGGVPQSSVRGLRHINGGGQYPAEVFNINNAARNLLEIIADQARSDNGDYKIRVYTIGMGDLVQYPLGTMPETPESILRRISNELGNLDYNGAQLAGKYYHAATAADVGPAFEAVQNQIIRLSR